MAEAAVLEQAAEDLPQFVHLDNKENKMSDQVVIVIEKETGKIENKIDIELSLLESGEWTYDPLNPDKYLLKHDIEDVIYTNIDEDEYIEEKDILQPIEAPSEGWVKDEFGVWTEMYNRPSINHRWNEDLLVWEEVVFD